MAKIHDHAMRGEREKGCGGGAERIWKENEECEAGREEGYGVGEVGGGILALKE